MRPRLSARSLASLVTVCLLILAGSDSPLRAQRLASPNDVTGAWHYRSFLNEPKQVPDLNKILFGEGDLILEESPTGTISGTGDFGDGDTMSFRGSVNHGNWITVRIQGVGTGPNNKDWLYDYVGVVIPPWPNGTNQVQALVGSVVRSAPHSNGSGGVVPAGRVASFFALRR
jgi:hypothetical protein